MVYWLHSRPTYRCQAVSTNERRTFVDTESPDKNNKQTNESTNQPIPAAIPELSQCHALHSTQSSGTSWTGSPHHDMWRPQHSTEMMCTNFTNPRQTHPMHASMRWRAEFICHAMRTSMKCYDNMPRLLRPAGPCSYANASIDILTGSRAKNIMRH